MHAIYDLFILLSWLTLIAYWAVLGRSAKLSVRSNWRWPREIGLRLAVLVLILLALHVFRAHHLRLRHYLVNVNLIAGFLGAALCAGGVILAIWARVCLGGNWGMPMAEKARPELITRGPYAYIRHPIYTGLILGMLGSAVGQSVLWAIPLFVAAPYFVYSARREERVMNEQFQLQYPGYRKRTKMLIPFIL